MKPRKRSVQACITAVGVSATPCDLENMIVDTRERAVFDVGEQPWSAYRS